MQPKHTFVWNIKALSAAMQIDVDDVVSYFTDGRRVSFILERHIAKWYKGKLAKSEGAAYDFTDKNGLPWEVRSITRGGVYFNPSVQVGAGRSFEERAFRAKLNSIHGFIVCDITRFPKVPIFEIVSSTVISWYDDGRLGVNARASHSKITKLIEEL